MNPTVEKSRIFSDQGIKNIAVFSDVLKRIHIRLIHEGYVIKDGKIGFSDEKIWLIVRLVLCYNGK